MHLMFLFDPLRKNQISLAYKDKKNWEQKNIFLSEGPMCLIIINLGGHFAKRHVD